MNVPHKKITEKLGITVRKVTKKSLVTFRYAKTAVYTNSASYVIIT
jgi:hypothetical protein